MAPQSRGKKPFRPPKPQQTVSTPDLLSLPSHQNSQATSPNRTPTGHMFPLAGQAQTSPTEPLSPPMVAPNSVDDEATEGIEETYEDEDDDEDFLYHYSVHPSSSNSSASSADDESPIKALPRRASVPYNLAGANPFAPPFYNRPPTPLPPSPSLTSLLRPTFSTTTSRPTTPDSSDAETPNDTEAAVAKSARTATTVPRASPKVPTYEYYGFVLYLVSSLVFLMYLLWSYLPSPFLDQLGISYYPNRWWSLAIPSFLFMSIVYIYVALASYNTGYLTLPMTSIENIVDEAANVASLDPRRKKHSSRRVAKGEGEAKASRSARKRDVQTLGPHGHPGRRREDTTWDGDLDWLNIWNRGTDAVMDVPVGGVCEILYGEARQTQDS